LTDVHVFYGKDSFSAHEAMEELKGRIDQDGMLADNTVKLDARDLKPDQLLVHCQTIPFLGSKRLVIVRGLLERFESKWTGRGRPKAKALGAWEQFPKALRDAPATTVLVFIDGEAGEKNPMLTALRPIATDIRRFRPLEKGRVASWVTQRAERYGVRLEGRATAAMTELVFDDLWTMDSELRKLAIYADGRQVTETDVRELVSMAREASEFAMADAVIEGRAADAMALVQRLKEEGTVPQGILYRLQQAYRRLLQYMDLQAQRLRPAEMMTKLGLRHPYALQVLERQGAAYTIETLTQAYARILQADLSIKRGEQDGDTAIELLVFDLAAIAKARAAGRPGYSRPRAAPAQPQQGTARA
jgi:DNA polymerase-3 subunit delta